VSVIGGALFQGRERVFKVKMPPSLFYPRGRKERVGGVFIDTRQRKRREAGRDVLPAALKREEGGSTSLLEPLLEDGGNPPKFYLRKGGVASFLS